MAKIEFLAGPNVRLSYTADDWQLYKLDGREDVAAQLNKEIARRAAKSPTVKEFSTNNILEPFSKWGACDSEGWHMLEAILAKIYKTEDHF